MATYWRANTSPISIPLRHYPIDTFLTGGGRSALIAVFAQSKGNDANTPAGRPDWPTTPLRIM